jgi:serine/threonine protein kinase
MELPAGQDRGDCGYWPPVAETAEPSCDGQLDAALAEQRRDWRDGKRISAAQRLKLRPALAAHAASAAELLYHDFLLRKEAGEFSQWDDYLSQFPQYAKELRALRIADELAGDIDENSDQDGSPLGDYEILDEIGSGGMGVVYRARQRSLRRVVAVKMLRAAELSQPLERERFLKEAWAVSQLNHPNIVHVYSVAETGGRPFISFEFVEGPSLADRIGGTPMDAQTAAGIVATVARAIHYANEHGIVHRDLKPANVLLSQSSAGVIPKVTDFGACKAIHEQSAQRETQIVGTPAYMAPEQLDGKKRPLTPRTDVYGLGTILYECLTGLAPFRGQTVAEVLRQVAEDVPVAPRLLNPDAPRDLETICLKCLSKNPDQRYATAGAVADDLALFREGKPVTARPIGPIHHAWMWCQRKPGTASLIAALVFAFIGGTAGIALQWQRAEAARKDAVASDLEAQELLGEVVQVSRAQPGTRDRAPNTGLDTLHRAETHCRNLLSRHPDETPIRIALTKVYGGLGSCYVERGQRAKAEASYRQAQTLWEPLAADPGSSAECRDWLATTYFWQYQDDLSRRVESLSQAVAIWVQLAADEPDDLDFLHRIWECRRQMAFLITSKLGRDQCLHFLESDRDQLSGLVLGNPNNRGLRSHLALTCFLLGEIYWQNQSTAKSYASWRESYSHYHTLAKDPRADFLCNIWGAICCSRLIQGAAADPYYKEAVLLLENSAQRVEALRKREPENDWLRAVVMQGYCCLTLSHARAGQAAKAEQIANDKISALVLPRDIDRLEREAALDEAGTLISAGQWLREANLTAPALRLARQAGTMCSRLAVYSSRDVGSLSELAFIAIACSALANQLGNGHLSLEQAELARRTLEELSRCVPGRYQEQFHLSAAWMRIAKAHWSLGDFDKAWAALLQSTAIQRRLFEREPRNPSYRAWLSQCYDRLVFYGSRAGNIDGAASAIMDRIKLWSDDPEKLSQSAEDFESLAEQVAARHRGKLSPEDQAECDRYIAESRRARDAAKRVASDLRAQN